MVYAGRTRDSLPFVDEVTRFGDRVQIRTDDVSGVPSAVELLGDCQDGEGVYACGPAPMLTLIRAQLTGRDNVELHSERFAAAPVIDGKEFSVSIASTGTTVRVGVDEACARRCAVPAGARRTLANRVSAGSVARGCSTVPSPIAPPCSPIPNATIR